SANFIEGYLKKNRKNLKAPKKTAEYYLRGLKGKIPNKKNSLLKKNKQLSSNGTIFYEVDYLSLAKLFRTLCEERDLRVKGKLREISFFLHAHLAKKNFKKGNYGSIFDVFNMIIFSSLKNSNKVEYYKNTYLLTWEDNRFADLSFELDLENVTRNILYLPRYDLKQELNGIVGLLNNLKKGDGTDEE
ncbi:MAG: hypothetical protein ABH850_02420, partial [Candidatus Micrarchaeota archaeon]